MVHDASFVLNVLLDRKSESGRFAGRIDVSRMGMLGHSLGGAAALRACQVDPRFKVGVDLDGDLWGTMQTEGLGGPFLVMLNEPAESHRPPAPVRERRDKDWADFIFRKKATAFVVKVSNTNHFSFTDFPFVIPESLMRKNGAEIAPQRGFEVISRVLWTFFSHFLNGARSESLETVAKSCPEIILKSYAGH